MRYDVVPAVLRALGLEAPAPFPLLLPGADG